jgi:antitoxin (DNA-binding transcriptional repressor) of toxin-antitoxin stability system
MQTLNIHETKTHLSRLIDRAARGGESFVIAKAGRPMALLSPLGAAKPKPPRRLGFLAGQIHVPDDFDEMGAAQIEQLFAA